VARLERVGMIRVGLLILIGAWIPLVVAGTLRPDSNPVGFGVLAWLGSLHGLAIVAIGVLILGVRLARALFSGQG
jgi:hypothetical protein